MQELEQLESIIQALQQSLETLSGRREALTTELDRITRAQSMNSAKAKTIGPGLEYKGTMYVHWNYIDIHAELLRRSLVDGWFLDTNLNRERMRRILPAAVRAVGLQWGTDVKTYWRRTQITDDKK